MKVVLLCGGLGTRLREETEFKPKPMVEIGGKPIVWHIMKHYASYGYNDFILCLGYKGDMIKDYFYNYELRTSDVTIGLGKSKSVRFHNSSSEDGWKVTLAETGQTALTGARVKRIARYLDGEPFLLTYGDGLCSVDIKKLVAFHKAHKRMATVTGVHPTSRFGELQIRGSRALRFSEKPRDNNMYINGGYFVFEPEFMKLLSDSDDCLLEGAPLEKISRRGGLSIFAHNGFWQCMDTYRDFQLLNKLWDSGKPPWL